MIVVYSGGDTTDCRDIIITSANTGLVTGGFDDSGFDATWYRLGQARRCAGDSCDNESGGLGRPCYVGHLFDWSLIWRGSLTLHECLIGNKMS